MFGWSSGRRLREVEASIEERDAVALIRRRLCLDASRDDELVEALGTRLGERDGLWSAGPADQRLATILVTRVEAGSS